MSFSLCLCVYGCTHPHNTCADTYMDHTYIYRKSLVLPTPRRYYVSLLVSLLFFVSHWSRLSLVLLQLVCLHHRLLPDNGCSNMSILALSLPSAQTVLYQNAVP